MARRTDRNAPKKRAAIYARVSDKSQAEEDKTSISEQMGDMEAYCEERGMAVVARYQEVGRGWSKKRPEFQRMLADARMGRFDTIVCWKSDRLSRGMYPAAALMEVVEAYRIGIEAVMDAIDMKTFGLMAAIGKIELDNFRERASMGKRGKAKQGRLPTGSPPYGYRVDEHGNPYVYEPEAKFIRRIFRQYAEEGMTAPAIVLGLERDGAPLPPRCSKWRKERVHAIMSSETYRGTYWYGKSSWVTTEDGTKGTKNPKDTWIGIPFPPLVDEKTWERVKARKFKRFSHSKRNTKTFYLLQHMVRCSECGLYLHGRAQSKKSQYYNGKRYAYTLDPPHRYYRCGGMTSHKLECRRPGFIKAERLEEFVWSEVKRMLQNPGLIVAGIESLGSQEDDGWEKEIDRAERELNRVQSEEDRAIRLYVSAKITEAQLDHQRKFITERLETLRRELDDYRAQQAALAEKRILMENILAWASKVGDRLDEVPDEQRKDILKLLLDQVVIDGDNNIRFTLGIPAEDLVSVKYPESKFAIQYTPAHFSGTNPDFGRTCESSGSPQATRIVRGLEQRTCSKGCSEGYCAVDPPSITSSEPVT